MSWYDIFSQWYDRSLEALYAEHRQLAAQALELAPGLCVLDVPTGTGQSLPHLAAALLPGGRLVAVDLSPGMLARARQRIAAAGWSHVTCLESDVLALSFDKPVDRIHVFLGFSAFADWQAAFAHLWQQLAPGGKMVIVDVYSEELTIQGRLVNWIARADIRRRTWEPLAEVGSDFRKVDLPFRREHGGAIFCASARKAQ